MIRLYSGSTISDLYFLNVVCTRVHCRTTVVSEEGCSSMSLVLSFRLELVLVYGFGGHLLTGVREKAGEEFLIDLTMGKHALYSGCLLTPFQLPKQG